MRIMWLWSVPCLIVASLAPYRPAWSRAPRARSTSREKSGRSWPRAASNVTAPTREAERRACASTPARTCSPIAAAIAWSSRDDPEESELIARITSEDPDEVMPPSTSRRQLTRAQVELLQRWVAEGASWSEHWSFIPPRRPEIPEVSNSGWCRNPIDRLVLARLDRAGLRPSPEADRVTLIRRLSLDLSGCRPHRRRSIDSWRTGGPTPTSGWWTACSPRPSSASAGPGPGSTWSATPTATATRTTDTGPMPGGIATGSSTPSTATCPSIGSRSSNWLATCCPAHRSSDRTAAGFHRMTMFNRSAVGKDNEEEFRVKTAKDRASTTATVWLGLTFGCAECHTHKYDPLPHRDYYRFYAFFNNLVDTQIPAPPLSGEHAPGLSSKRCGSSRRRRRRQERG